LQNQLPTGLRNELQNDWQTNWPAAARSPVSARNAVGRFLRLSAAFKTPSSKGGLCGLAVVLMVTGTSLPPAEAISETFEPQSGEAATLEDCNRRTCTMLREKNPRGEDLQCNLTKTWPQATIKRADTLVLRWKFGDARCSVQLHVRRADIVGALTQPQYKLEVPAHTADCLIEDAGQLRTISATLSPRIVFQKGKAEKIWVNLISADGGAGITKFLWAAAKLEDTTGLFHSAMVKAVNSYIYDQCPAKYPRAMVSPKS
jgi:hypothetical protein